MKMTEDLVTSLLRFHLAMPTGGGSHARFPARQFVRPHPSIFQLELSINLSFTVIVNIGLLRVDLKFYSNQTYVE